MVTGNIVFVAKIAGILLTLNKLIIIMRENFFWSLDQIKSNQL